MPQNKKSANNKNKSESFEKNSKESSSKGLPSGKEENKSRGGRREPIKEVVPASPESARFVHQLIPYILLVLSVFTAACFIFVAAGAGGSVGVIGGILNNIFCGLFGWPAFIIPLVLINLALFWRKYVDMHLLGLKLTFSFLIVLAASALVHVITLNEWGSAGFYLPGLWSDGVAMRGGGVLGGLLGELAYMALGIVGSLIILIPLIGVLFIFLIATTPRGIMLYLKYRAKLRAERRQNAREAEEAAYAGDETDEAAAKGKKNAKDDSGLSRRDKKELKKTKKEKEDDKHRRHEILTKAEAEPKESVFTEGHQPLTNLNHAAADSMNAKTDAAPAINSDIPLTAAPDFNEATPSTVINASENGKNDKNSTVILPPMRSGGVNSLTEQLEHDEDYNDLNDLLHGTPPAKAQGASASAKPAAQGSSDKAKDDLDMGLIVSTEDISELIESEGDEPITSGKQLVEYIFPPYDLLAADSNPKEENFTEELRDNAKRLMETLGSFNVRIKEINYSRGPTITRYELKPDTGVRVRSIANLVDDISLSLATTGVRIEAPIPGKPAVGVEVPNRTQATVFLRTLIESQTFADTPSRLAVCLGEDVAGKPIYFNIDKMPHLLIAGATGMGKSVCINSIIVSVLYKAKPDEVKLILVDPKKVEFNVYREMPHLYVPVVSDPKKAAGVLATAVAEMERRFEMIESVNVRDITNYNRIAESDPDLEMMPRLVIIIDELADLMMTAPDDVETAICRLAQKARAAGIHLIIGTQRPSVDVITGLIKANVPSRIAFTVASQVDSRTIIDIGGAEKLIGRGDMLFAPVGSAKPMRVQGAFVGEMEVENIVDYIKTHNDTAKYDDEFVKRIEEEAAKCGNSKKGGGSTANIEDISGDGNDPKLREAVELAIETGKISTSLMQRRLEVGYGRAAKIIDQMEQLGYVSAADGNKPRRVLITKEQFMEKMINDDAI